MPTLLAASTTTWYRFFFVVYTFTCFLIAAMILGGWMPFGALGAGLLFGFADALQMRLQGAGLLAPQIIQAIPYIVTVVVLAGFVRKRTPPSDYQPYEKE